MDFFSAQDHARRNTGRLVFFFVLAVLSIVTMTNLLVMLVFGYLRVGDTAANGTPLPFDWQVFGVVSLGVLAVVALGTLYKQGLLSGGGARVAEMMDGRLLAHGGGDLDQQKVLNVVEEMAIAAGLPVPPVYLIEDDAINAFAAGYAPGDAVIGITTGAISKLSRDQLQGVIAHEFSHILNGDMRLNIRLIGILHGILLLGLIGYHVLRSGRYSRRSKGSGGIVFLGLGLVVIGYSGTFFGNLIKAAVSRQREFLADAAAVQFTRNPSGIAGALKRIGTDSRGAVLAHPGTSEISHALFCQGFTSFWGSLFATHPPLEVRIGRIESDWDGSFEEGAAAGGPGVKRQAQAVTRAGGKTVAGVAGLAAAVGSVGNPTEQHMGYARELLDSLPGVLKQAAREPYVARAVVYGLLLDEDEAMRNRQLEVLAQDGDRLVHDETIRFAGRIRQLPPASRLPLLDLTLPALRQLSEQQYLQFRDNIKKLIEADSRLSLFEWALQKIVTHRLDGAFGGTAGKRAKATTLPSSAAACSQLLSLLVHSCRHQGLTAEQVFAAAARELDVSGVRLLGRGEISFAKLNQAIDELNGLKPLAKQQLLKALASAALADRQINPVEAELLRAMADTLDCPMPPLVV